MDSRLPWLAGLWDGEGSIGARVGLSATGYRAVTLNVQMEMKDEGTVLRAAQILDEYGMFTSVIKPRRRAESHGQTWHLSVKRMTSAYAMAGLMLPFVVTKYRHWEILREFTGMRIEKVGLRPDGSGKLKQGGAAKPWGPEEMELAYELGVLNWCEGTNRVYPDLNPVFGLSARGDRRDL